MRLPIIMGSGIIIGWVIECTLAGWQSELMNIHLIGELMHVWAMQTQHFSTPSSEYNECCDNSIAVSSAILGNLSFATFLGLSLAGRLQRIVANLNCIFLTR